MVLSLCRFCQGNVAILSWLIHVLVWSVLVSDLVNGLVMVIGLIMVSSLVSGLAWSGV